MGTKQSGTSKAQMERKRWQPTSPKGGLVACIDLYFGVALVCFLPRLVNSIALRQLCRFRSFGFVFGYGVSLPPLEPHFLPDFAHVRSPLSNETIIAGEQRQADGLGRAMK